jgi:hypothetical protein
MQGKLPIAALIRLTFPVSASTAQVNTEHKLCTPNLLAR